MKYSNLYKVLGVGALALSLAALPATLPANAQTAGDTTTDVDTTPDGATDGNWADGDWGLLGLLGLFGLLGRRNKDRDDVNAGYRDASEVSSSTRSRY